jgi:hypothetical protein
MCTTIIQNDYTIVVNYIVIIIILTNYDTLKAVVLFSSPIRKLELNDASSSQFKTN